MPVPPTTASVDELVRRGRITAALACLRDVERLDVTGSSLLLECRLARGEMDLAIQLGEELAAAPRTDPHDDARASLALGTLCAAIGRNEDAVASFHAVDAVAGGRADPVELPWRAGAAVSLIRLGRRHEAEQLAEEQLRLARASGSAYATAEAIRTAAAVCIAIDRRALLREAHSLVAGRYERLAAQVATDLAGLVALMATDDAGHTEAVALLRSAERYADEEDLWPLHSRVRRLLERLGEAPVVPRSEAVARLSAAELRTARLAAMGGTNRSIAEHLGVTVKAVEWHLSHTYRKLGIKGRTELPGILRAG